MMVVTRIPELRRTLADRRRAGPIGLVPTMGALHAGHASLFGQARAECATVVASVFVNPRQFNDAADLAAYPRQEARDAELSGAAGVDIFFAPKADDIYPAGHATVVEVGGPAFGLEGDYRPGHFAGVATVCVILFNLVGPDAVYFGQKDAQQVAVIRQVVRDLGMPVDVRVGPTVREADGLALSSRNARLAPEDRRRAAAIPRALRAAVEARRAGSDPVKAARGALSDLETEYVGLTVLEGQTTLVVAVRAGGVRLIDNVPLDAPALAGL
ncbi:MAG TPA: pantoate--beta-alanine ligase [Vicinamibacterales bacterium]|nr:pantoate--beta-alanine ligase [Vicinamibacterales bacterium]